MRKSQKKTIAKTCVWVASIVIAPSSQTVWVIWFKQKQTHDHMDYCDFVILYWPKYRPGCIAPESLLVFDTLILSSGLWCYATYFKVSHLSEPGLPQSFPKQSTKKKTSLYRVPAQGNRNDIIFNLLTDYSSENNIIIRTPGLIVFHLSLVTASILLLTQHLWPAGNSRYL